MTPYTLPVLLRFLASARTLTLLTLVTCAALTARAASSLASARMLTAEAPTTAAPPARTQPAAAPSRSDRAIERPRRAEALVARNMFCSSCVSSAEVLAGTVVTSAVLIETSLGAEPRATLRVISTQVQGSWGIGEPIPGLGVLDRIAPRWIELIDGGGHRGRLWLVELEARAPSTAPPQGAAGDEPWPQRLDDHTFAVDRSLVRALVTGSLKPGSMRFTPVGEAGEFKGIVLRGVGPGTVAAALGLKNGDMLESVDGARITGLQPLIDLYARLDQVGSVTLTGTRAGKPLTIELRLR